MKKLIIFMLFISTYISAAELTQSEKQVCYWSFSSKRLACKTGKIDQFITLFPQLSRLNRWIMILSERAITDEGAIALAPHLGKLTSIKILDLSQNQIGDAGAIALAPHLGKLTKLWHLVLSQNQIGDAGATALAPYLGKLTSLKGINLSHNQIGDAGATAFAPHLGKPMYIDLSSNQIGNTGATALAIHLSKINPMNFGILCLYKNQIGYAGATVLAEHFDKRQLSLDFSVEIVLLAAKFFKQVKISKISKYLSSKYAYTRWKILISVPILIAACCVITGCPTADLAIFATLGSAGALTTCYIKGWVRIISALNRNATINRNTTIFSVDYLDIFSGVSCFLMAFVLKIYFSPYSVIHSTADIDKLATLGLTGALTTASLNGWARIIGNLYYNRKIDHSTIFSGVCGALMGFVLKTYLSPYSDLIHSVNYLEMVAFSGVITAGAIQWIEKIIKQKNIGDVSLILGSAGAAIGLTKFPVSGMKSIIKPLSYINNGVIMPKTSKSKSFSLMIKLASSAATYLSMDLATVLSSPYIGSIIPQIFQSKDLSIAITAGTLIFISPILGMLAEKFIIIPCAKTTDGFMRNYPSLTKMLLRASGIINLSAPIIFKLPPLRPISQLISFGMINGALARQDLVPWFEHKDMAGHSMLLKIENLSKYGSCVFDVLAIALGLGLVTPPIYGIYCLALATLFSSISFAANRIYKYTLPKVKKKKE